MIGNGPKNKSSFELSAWGGVLLGAHQFLETSSRIEYQSQAQATVYAPAENGRLTVELIRVATDYARGTTPSIKSEACSGSVTVYADRP
jgi:hypothetical protein